MDEKNVLAPDSLCDESQSIDFRGFESTDCSKHAALLRVLACQNRPSQLETDKVSDDFLGFELGNLNKHAALLRVKGQLSNKSKRNNINDLDVFETDSSEELQSEYPINHFKEYYSSELCAIDSELIAIETIKNGRRLDISVLNKISQLMKLLLPEALIHYDLYDDKIKEEHIVYPTEINVQIHLLRDANAPTHASNHYVVSQQKDGFIYIYDSCDCQDNTRISNQLRIIYDIASRVKDLTTIIRRPKCQQQENDIDCGIFAIYNAVLLYHGCDPSNADLLDVQMLREFLLLCFDKRGNMKLPSYIHSTAKSSSIKEKLFELIKKHECDPSEQFDTCQNIEDNFQVEEISEIQQGDSNLKVHHSKEKRPACSKNQLSEPKSKKLKGIHDKIVAHETKMYADVVVGNIGRKSNVNRVVSTNLEMHNGKHKLADCKNLKYNKLKKSACDSVSNEEISGKNALDGGLNDLEVIEVSANENQLFLPVDKEWQKNKSDTINVSIHQLNNMYDSSRSNDATNFRIRSITEDGNCFYRCISYILTGSEDSHILVRQRVVAHMKTSDVATKLLHGGHIQIGVEHYLEYKRRSNVESTWASEVEIYVAANLLETPIWTFSCGRWVQHSPSMSVTCLTDEHRSIYLHHKNGNHYEVVTGMKLDLEKKRQYMNKKREESKKNKTAMTSKQKDYYLKNKAVIAAKKRE